MDLNCDRLREFQKFVEKDLTPGVDELASLSEGNRKHVQKLVYTNLVDRFDYAVDKFLLDNCKNEELLEIALRADNNPVTERDLIELLLKGDGLQDALQQKVMEKLRISALRQRHSQKLQTLLSLCNQIGDFKKRPRVNISSGDIVDTFKIHNKKIPHAISGYADWLYSRRNAIVHGAGSSSYLNNDRKMIKKHFGVEVTKTFKISISSIRNASNFYLQLCGIIYQSS
ncbi:MAG: hypothetical protein R6V56_04300 [Lentisphaeria bacterium]